MVVIIVIVVIVVVVVVVVVVVNGMLKSQIILNLLDETAGGVLCGIVRVPNCKVQQNICHKCRN